MPALMGRLNMASKVAQVPVAAQGGVLSPDLDQLDNVAGTAQEKTTAEIEMQGCR
jgi:hypothetical protein